METEIDLVFKENGLEEGRSIAWSKEAYKYAFPKNKTYFGAKIYVLGSKEKIWEGDIDMNFDSSKLSNICKKLEKDLYIISEEEGILNDNEIIERSSAKITYQ